MDQERFWILFSKKLANEATVSELKEYEDLIQENPEWQYAIQNIEDLWKFKPKEDYMQAEDAYMLHLNRMKEKGIILDDGQSEIPVIGHSKRKIKWYWVAASLVGLVVLFSVTSMLLKESVKKPLARQVNEITTRLGSKSKVELPDGSTVWLNAGSKLTYKEDFGKEIREVSLSGEGFFDVTKMKDKPFIIHTSSIDIKVLGTVFNVMAYPEDKRTETSLIRGRVEVTIRSRPNDKIILSPNEKLVVENDKIIEDGRRKIAKEPIETPVTTSSLVSVDKLKYSPIDSTLAEIEWIKNRLVFRDESFDDLAVQMERWYAVSIEIKDKELEEKRLTGIFDLETVDEALEALKISVPFKYEHNGNSIIIHR